MIVLDSSALTAIVLDEPESDAFARMVATNDCVIGAPTLLETEMVVRSKAHGPQLQKLNDLLALKNVSVIAFTPEHAQVAYTAFARFGRGSGHPARLNFGDCMAYAVARMAQAPLLFKGDDFTRTDVASAIPS